MRTTAGSAVVYWKRCEVENYVVTPDVLLRAVAEHYGDAPLFAEETGSTAETVLEALILERVFDGRAEDLATWKAAGAEAARLRPSRRSSRRPPPAQLTPPPDALPVGPSQGRFPELASLVPPVPSQCAIVGAMKYTQEQS